MSYKNPKWDNDWDGLVFRSKNGKPIGNGALNTSLARIVKNINKDRIVLDDDNYQEFKTCTVHSLRHTFATRCIEKGYLLILSVNMPELNIWQLYTIIITMLIEM